MMMQALGRNYVRYVNVTYKRSGTLWEVRCMKSRWILIKHFVYFFGIIGALLVGLPVFSVEKHPYPNDSILAGMLDDMELLYVHKISGRISLSNYADLLEVSGRLSNDVLMDRWEEFRSYTTKDVFLVRAVVGPSSLQPGSVIEASTSDMPYLTTDLAGSYLIFFSQKGSGYSYDQCYVVSDLGDASSGIDDFLKNSKKEMVAAIVQKKLLACAFRDLPNE